MKKENGGPHTEIAAPKSLKGTTFRPVKSSSGMWKLRSDCSEWTGQLFGAAISVFGPLFSLYIIVFDVYTFFVFLNVIY